VLPSCRSPPLAWIQRPSQQRSCGSRGWGSRVDALLTTHRSSCDGNGGQRRFLPGHGPPPKRNTNKVETWPWWPSVLSAPKSFSCRDLRTFLPSATCLLLDHRQEFLSGRPARLSVLEVLARKLATLDSGGLPVAALPAPSLRDCRGRSHPGRQRAGFAGVLSNDLIPSGAGSPDPWRNARMLPGPFAVGLVKAPSAWMEASQQPIHWRPLCARCTTSGEPDSGIREHLGMFDDLPALHRCTASGQETTAGPIKPRRRFVLFASSTLAHSSLGSVSHFR